MPEAFYQDDIITLYHGEALEVLRELPDNSVDSLCTDPPAGISFMAKTWDTFKGDTRQADEMADSNAGQFKRSKDGNKSPREWFVANLTPIFRECLRILKPGSYGLVWALPRTSHWTAWALEDAGFEIRDRVTHIFGSGFPKSLDISKAIDAAAGVEREVVARRNPNGKYGLSISGNDNEQIRASVKPISQAATDAAKQWDGWGTALKPGVEDWWLVRKPLDGTTVNNVLAHGTGGLNIDACRVSGPRGEGVWGSSNQTCQEGRTFNASPSGEDYHREMNASGRWPANLILSHSADCELVGRKKIAAISGGGGLKTTGTMTYGDFAGKEYDGPLGYGDPNGQEEVEDWRCVDDCPVRILNVQSGDRKAGGSLSGAEPSRPGDAGTVAYGKFNDSREWNSYSDSGGASRFFYCAKASVEDREEGLEDLIAQARDESRKEGNPGGDNPRNRGLRLRKNHHPTVKATDLMRWLVRLITPPGGTVLDCFAGSGSTGKACAKEGLKAVLIEQELAYCEIAARRARLRQPKLMFTE